MPSPQEEQPSIISTVGAADFSNIDSNPSSTEYMSREDSIVEDDDDEARLLAELEAERLAEEMARQKQRELEEKLANARGKKPQNHVSIIQERGGDRDQGSISNYVQDSMSSLL
jgi:hypothetical protein